MIIENKENSNYTINDINIKKILTELASYANHYATTQIYQSVLRYYLDPRIFIGFCLRTGFDYTVFYSPYKFKVIGTWLTNWVGFAFLEYLKRKIIYSL